MSRPASPLLHAVSYQQVPETDNRRKPPALHIPNKKPISGIEIVHTHCISPSSSERSVKSEISYTHSDIETMNHVLFRARQNGELPSTTSSPTDAQAVIQDYGFLTRLREARGDARMPAPTTYTELRVEVARRIKDRDSSRDDEESRQEAIRRVHHYLNTLGTEKRFFDANSNTAERPSSARSDIESFGESILSIVGQAADQTMVDAAEPLRFNVQQLKTHNSEYDRLLSECDKLVNHQQDLTRALSAMINPQSKAIQTSGENLALLTGIVTHLSHFAMNLPYVVEQAVQRAVHEQTETAIQHVLQAQQEAVLSLLQRRQENTQSNQVINYDLLSASIVSKLQTSGCISLSPEQSLAKEEKGTRDGLRKFWHRVKPSIMTR
ncbi:unnamed protein product [Clonostachys rosea f. rosea IK726]|uniref:Uncharacterized protein n=1 Tax=Clonostachys rosea f. rosea IK726 TaxID=1349383 RepID=A0ACA9TUG5_BIOOC|nr:unnamed protein product [Clonostachys rosea f. rosea IK726]